jgi:hypothetical protein
LKDLKNIYLSTHNKTTAVLGKEYLTVPETTVN